MRYALKLNVNGEGYEVSVPALKPLLEVIREDLGLTGAKRGCEDGRCGACTVIFNGRPVKSCLTLALQTNGGQITTVEGLAHDGQLHPLQAAFLDHGAVQCGYCTPGMLMALKALLDADPNPAEADVIEVLKGHLCRCGTYFKVVEAVRACAGR